MREFLFLFACFILCASCPSTIFSSEIRIEGDRVIVKNDNGDVIDTANLPKGKNVQTSEDVEINEKGISIGSVSNKNGEMKKVTRSTKLENVTIINNGKTTTYNKKD